MLSVLRSLKVSDQPVAWEKALKAVLYLLVGFAVVSWTEGQIVLVLAVVESVVGLVVWSSVTPNTRVAEQVDTAVRENTADIHAFLSSLPAKAKK